MSPSLAIPMSLDLHGLIPATVLPMTEDARVDELGLRRWQLELLERHILEPFA